MSDSDSSAALASPRFDCIEARAADDASAEHALAEAVAAGACGAEQRDAERGVTLLLYAPSASAAAVALAAAGVLGADAVGAPRAVEPRDWSEAWKAGLRAIEVSQRLRIRPSFDATRARAGQRDLVIDPGQAFGTGGHESTQLALAWIDAQRGELGARGAFLDVGTGSGVLALAALALGSGRAIGFDVDARAVAAARANARANGFASRFHAFTGAIDALAPGARFAAIAANLLRRELEPQIDALAARLVDGGWIAISGLLADELDAWTRRSAGAGLRVAGTREQTDASGATWIGLLMRRAQPRARGAASRATGSAAPSR